MSNTAILTAPKFVSQLPAAQRKAFAPKASELQAAVEAFVQKLHGRRDEYALAAQGVVSHSSIYEAFRTAGCEVRIVKQTDEQGNVKVERRTDSKGQPKDYPVCDVYVMLPKGEIQNRSGRTKWVAPAKRYAALRQELTENPTADRKAEIELSIEKLLERNPSLRPAAVPATA